MKETFPIVPASSGPIWILVAVALFLVVLVGMFGYFAYSSRNVRFETSHEALHISGGLYGRSIPMQDLVLDSAKSVDLTRDQEYRLTSITNGVGLPGYSAGWFRLGNGETALAFVTDKRSVLYLPTTKDYSLLLSVTDPDALISSLRRARAPGTRGSETPPPVK